MTISLQICKLFGETYCLILHGRNVGQGETTGKQLSASLSILVSLAVRT
jgi:hypothetical protein